MKGLIVRAGTLVTPFVERSLPKTVTRILLFKLGAIGDVCMTTPLIRSLRKVFKGAKIDYCCGSWSRPVLENNPHLSDIYTFNDKIFYKKDIPRMLALARRIRKRNYDLIFILDRSWMVNSYARLLGGYTIGFDRAGEGFSNNFSVPYNDTKHDIEFYLDLGRELGCDTKNTDMEIFFTPAEKKFASEMWKKKKLTGKKVIGVFPGGAKNPGQEVALKRWPLNRFVQVVEELVKEHHVVLFGGPTDMEFSDAFAHIKSSRLVNMIGAGSLRESASLMARCNCFVTNDSGPMHLAVASGVPTVNFFGPTNPVKLAPLGSKHITLKTTLSCQPCYKDGSYPDCQHHSCMRMIHSDEVIEAVRSILK